MNSKPKVMHIITRLDMGGSAQNTLLTCLNLTDKYELILVHGLSRESRMTDLEREKVESQIEAAQKKGVKVISVPALIRKIDPVQDLKAFVFIWKLIKLEKPESVHTHSSKAGLLGRLAAKISNVPAVIHTPHGHVFFGHFNPFISNLFLVTERFFDRMTDCMVALTQGEKEDYVKLSVSKENKMVTIHSGVDIDQFTTGRNKTGEKKEKLGLNPNSLVVGTVGWLLPIKGPSFLLEAMAAVWRKFPTVSLVYVGKGELEQRLKSDAVRLGVADRVHFLGWRDDIPKIMQTFDVFVLPSLNEGMGRVLVEAMATGKAVVASNVGGIPDLVKHGQNGFLIKPGDIYALSFYIEKLLGDETLRSDMGEIGQTMSRNFSVKKMVDRIDRLYISFLQNR
jgi:glycosyltransferase involved in cell wall biosynthesis